MAATDPLPAVALDDSDLADLLTLSDEAGWNQIAADWRVFLSRGAVFGCRAPSGRAVASAALLPYDGGFGWISMVLVTGTWRRRGLATALVQECIELARRLDIVPILDATPEGAQVYGALGFKPVFPLVRWSRAGGSHRPDDGRDAAGMVRLIEADTQAFGADRAFLLSDLAQRRDSRIVWCGDPAGGGGAIVRAGCRAYHVGPLVGASEAGAVTVLKHAAAAISGPLIADVPERWSHLAATLRDLGFQPQRSFLRMAMGQGTAFGKPDRLFCAAGPEFG